jgi:biopolymer transport protein ExbB/TolQ
MVAIVAEKLDKAPTSKQFTDKKPREGLSAPASKADAMTWETIRNLIHDEWAILSLLLLWSVAGVAVICERIYSLWRVLPKSETFKNRVVEAVEKGDLAKAAALCETANDPLGEVFGRGLRIYAKTPQKTTEAVNSQRTVAVAGFKRYLWALGTVGSSAPFVGLFGTVVGILKAFQSMSQAGTGGFKVVSQGIAAALVATAAGLLVAIYAIIAYNYFVAKVGAIGVQYKVFCEEFLFALGDLAKAQGAPASAPQAQPADKAPPS